MITVFKSNNEKDRSGHPKTIYAVTGAKTRNAALDEVAKYKKKSSTNIRLTHSARVATICDDGLYWDNLGHGEKCWAVRIKNEIHE